jgi:glycosyl transferase family 25
MKVRVRPEGETGPVGLVDGGADVSGMSWVIYVVGLPRRSDRRTRVGRCLDLASVPYEIRYASDLGLMVDWRDLDAESIAKSTYQNWRIDGTNPWWNRPLKLGEIACSLSHLNVWSLAARSGHGAIILEDDATMRASFGTDLENAVGTARR